MKTYQRTLSNLEKSRLKRSVPWFGKRRRDRLADIEQGLVEIHEFDIHRVWDINGCRPPCCPFTILFETTDQMFVFVESWARIERQESSHGESKLVIESTPTLKRLIKCTVEGLRPIKHTEELREFNEFFEITDDAEWRIFKKAEMPDEVIATLEAA